MIYQTNRMLARTIVVAMALTMLVTVSPGLAASKVDIAGKVVLANVDKHRVHFRVGNVRKEIAPNKASLLSPKQFPVNIEYWNGLQTGPSWESRRIAAAGVYKFRYQNGRWNLEQHQAKPATRPTTIPSSRSRTTSPFGSYRRITGAAPRIARSRRPVYYSTRYPVLHRVAGSVLSLYRFVQDEADRELLRDIIIDREIDREIERDFWDRLDDSAVNLPADERLEFDRALDDLKDLSDDDLKQIEGASDADWDQVRDGFGDLVDDNAWRDLEADYGDIDLNDLSDQDIMDLGEVGIDTLDSDVDLGDLDSGGLDLGDLGGTLDNVDVGDLSGGINDVDLGDVDLGSLGGDYGGGLDAGDFGDAGFDAGGLDAGGFDTEGFDGGGGFDAGGWGGGFDYDAGGFDDYGGGFDDFGGGGFDDFGGGFDDFGGGFDF